MSINKRIENDMDQRFFIFVVSLAVPFVLYFNRNLDNNRLTSWNWVFDANSLLPLFILLVLVLALAWLLSLFSFYVKQKGLILFLAASLTASCFWSEPEVIVDAARYFTQAKHLELYGVGFFVEQWGKAVFAWTDLPLMPFLYGLVFEIFGEQRVFIQILNTFFYAMTAVLTYLLGKSLWDEDTGFWGGLLLLGFPYLYTQVPLLLVDVATMFFFMLAVVATVIALKKGGAARLLAAALSLSLVFFVKYSSWMLLSLIPVIYACLIWQNPGPTIRRGMVLALLTFVLIGTAFLLYKDTGSSQLEFLLKYQKPGLQRWGEGYISTFLFQIHPFITAAALFAIGAAIRKKDFRLLIVGFLLLLFFVMQVKRIRYTIPLFPMVALMAAYGLEKIPNRKLLPQIVFSVIGTSVVVAVFGFLPFLKTLGVQNLQAAGKYLNTLAGSSVEVLTLAGDDVVINPATSVAVLDIYTDKEIIYRDAGVSPEVLERTKASPLRFTWEFASPPYYLAGPDAKEADVLVVIADDPARHSAPDHDHKTAAYPFQRTFDQSSNIFQHQTYVTVYHK